MSDNTVSTRYLQGYFDQLVSWGYNDAVYHDELGGGLQAISATTPLGDYTIVINEEWCVVYRTEEYPERGDDPVWGSVVEEVEMPHVADFDRLYMEYSHREEDEHSVAYQPRL